MAGRMNTALVVALVLTLLAPPLVAQDWAGKGRAQGLVKDEAGNPLSDARITLLFPPDSPIGGPEPFTTNKKGRWNHSPTRPLLVNVRLQKSICQFRQSIPLLPRPVPPSEAGLRIPCQPSAGFA